MVKPAMVVLLSAVLTGVVAVPLLQHQAPAAQSPDFGYANPDTWRFESRQGAQATTEGDLGKDFTVRVTQKGPSADCVYLRNAFNLDLNQERKPMRLLFEARTVPAGGEKTTASAPFPITFIVRDSKTLLWSERVQAGPTWEKFDRKIQLKKSDLLNVIAAAHLGESVGAVEIKNLRVVDGSN